MAGPGSEWAVSYGIMSGYRFYRPDQLERARLVA
jgi:hypothetical protein